MGGDRRCARRDEASRTAALLSQLTGGAAVDADPAINFAYMGLRWGEAVALRGESVVRAPMVHKKPGNPGQNGVARRVPLEGVEPPTVSLGRNCSSIELQRRAESDAAKSSVEGWIPTTSLG